MEAEPDLAALPPVEEVLPVLLDVPVAYALGMTVLDVVPF